MTFLDDVTISLHDKEVLRRSQMSRLRLLPISPDCIRRDFNRVVWEVQSCRVRPTLDNRGESGPIAWKNRVVWEGSHTTRFFNRFHHTKYMCHSFQIRSTTLLILTFIFRRCKIPNFYLHATPSSFLTVIDVILTAQWKGVVIATSRLLLFVYCCTLTFFSVPTHTRRPSL